MQKHIRQASELELREKLHGMKRGDSITVYVGEGGYHDAQYIAQRYNRARKRIAEYEPYEGHSIKITLIGYSDDRKYSMLDLKKEGDKVVFDVGSEKEQSLRVQASQHAKQLGLSSTVRRISEGVLEVALIDRKKQKRLLEEVKASFKDDPKPLRHNLHLLKVGDHAKVPLYLEKNQNTIRSYCHYHGMKLGWKFSVTIELVNDMDDSYYLITRTA